MQQRVSLRVGVQVKSGTVEDFVQRYIRDISVGGVFLELEQSLPTGSTVELELPMEEGAPVRGVGRVMWSRPKEAATEEMPAGVGVQFVEIRDADRSRVEGLVERHSVAPPAPPSGGDR